MTIAVQLVGRGGAQMTERSKGFGTFHAKQREDVFVQTPTRAPTRDPGLGAPGSSVPLFAIHEVPN